MSTEELRTPNGRVIPGDAVHLETMRSGGPGGQHANTSDTAIRARLRVRDAGLSRKETELAVSILGEEITVTARRSRSQLRNRQAALLEVLDRLDRALLVQEERRPTRPRTAVRSRERRDREHRSRLKAERSARFGKE